MDKGDLIFIAGHTGLIGSAFLRRLHKDGYENLLTASHSELDLTQTDAVSAFFNKHSPDYVILAAGKVGGIIENQTYPADFINTNISIQLNVMRCAQANGVKKLIFFASSCMYPKFTTQPMEEAALMTGPLETSSMAYAISKLAGLEMCLAYNLQYNEQRFIPVIPNSAYGPFDNFDPESGHVLSALIRRFHDAKTGGDEKVTLWGSGAPRREFVHADDIVDACLFLTRKDELLELPINIGVGEDYSIMELAEKISRLVGFEGRIDWDRSKPDGAPSKLLDSSRLHKLGWKPRIEFERGLQSTYEWYQSQLDGSQPDPRPEEHAVQTTG